MFDLVPGLAESVAAESLRKQGQEVLMLLRTLKTNPACVNPDGAWRR